jgi:hypothetical protein
VYLRAILSKLWQGSDIKEFDENVVGSKVKVWWPKDRQ